MHKLTGSPENFEPNLDSASLSALFGLGKMKFMPGSRASRVLLVGNGDAFSDGVAVLLARRSDLFIKQTVYLDNLSILKDVMQSQPDVVVLITSRAMNIEVILGMLMSTQTVSNLRLVILSLNSSAIEIYQANDTLREVKSANIIPTRVDDFLELINKGADVFSYTHPH